MSYNLLLAERIRTKMSSLPDVKEKQMMGGLTFMYNDKMCMGVIEDEIMCRVDPDAEETALQKKGSRPMDFTGRPMKGFIMVSQIGIKSETDLDYWIKLCLDYNPKARSSKMRKIKQQK